MFIIAKLSLCIPVILYIFLYPIMHVHLAITTYIHSFQNIIQRKKNLKDSNYKNVF